MGGTGFMGRRLVNELLRSHHDVTVATSGKTASPFGDRVSTIVFNRFDAKSVKKSAESLGFFDLLFDQIGFGPRDVSSICDSFHGKVGHYIYVSTIAVYRSSVENLTESDFNPDFVPKQGGIRDLGYIEGKRNAEAYLLRNAPFPFAVARFPIVLGFDDFTGRFQFHVRRVLDGEKIVVPLPLKQTKFIWVDDAGRFLAWLGTNTKVGPYNGASSPLLDTDEVILSIGNILGRAPVVSRAGEKRDTTPYDLGDDYNMSTAKAETEGFRFTDFGDWFPREVKMTAERGREMTSGRDYSLEALGS